MSLRWYHSSSFVSTDMRLSSSGIQFKPKSHTSSPTECIPTAGYRSPNGSDTDVVRNWNIIQHTTAQKLASLTKYMTSNMNLLQNLRLQWCYSTNIPLAPSMHCLQDSLPLAAVFEVCVPSNKMPSHLTPSSQLSLGFPTLLLLWIICCSTPFATQFPTIPTICYSTPFATQCPTISTICYNTPFATQCPTIPTICYSTPFATQCPTIPITHPAHCNCLNLINAVALISSYKS